MTSALLVVDMLHDFVDGALANPAARPTIAPTARLIDAARRAGWPVIYGNDAHQPGDLEFAVFGEHALAGSPGGAVIPQLAPANGDIVVPKRFYSTFTDTDLDATCRVHRIDHLVLAGQHTDCCCRHTSYDAYLRGINVTVVSDPTASTPPPTPPRTASSKPCSTSSATTAPASPTPTPSSAKADRRQAMREAPRRGDSPSGTAIRQRDGGAGST